MATNFEQPFGRLRPGRVGSRRYDGQAVRWLLGLAAVVLLLALAALGIEDPTERVPPDAVPSVEGAAPEQPVFDGRGKWTGY
jgi:hypothetical protein